MFSLPSVTAVFVLSWLLILRTGASLHTIHKYFNVTENQVVVTSDNFPTSCCMSRNYQIDYTGPEQQYLRLEFTDIDIPLGSIITLLDSDDNPLPDQPTIQEKTYIRRGFAFNGSSIKLVFSARQEEFNSFYAGFRAVVTATTALPTQWDFWPTSERCVPVNSLMEGGTLALRSDPSIYEFDVRSLPSMPLHDCIWVLKKPVEFSSFSVFRSMFVYLRFDELSVDKQLLGYFSMEVRGGRTSQAPLIRSVQAELDIEDGLIEAPVTDLYIRLRLPYTLKQGRGVDMYRLRAVYGMAVPLDAESRDCTFGPLPGFLCSSIMWCVPSSYKCDGIPHCKGSDDEEKAVCAVTKPLVQATTPSTTASTMRKSSQSQCSVTERWCTIKQMCVKFRDYDIECLGFGCPSFQKKCPDGRCIDLWYDCNGCDSFEQKCQNGDCISSYDRCPEDPCEYPRTYRCDEGRTCTYDTYVCDGGCDCNDCSDENSEDCSSSLGLSGGVIAAIVTGVLCGAALMCFCCIKCCSTGQTTTATRANVQPITSGTPLQPVVSGSSPHTPYTGYTPIPTIESPGQQDNGTAASRVAANTAVSAPPAYNEALNPMVYPPPPVRSTQTTTDLLPPPPSYESVASTPAV